MELEARAQRDAQNRWGDTALIVASRNGDLELVRRLLEARASPNLRNGQGAAAADIAEARAFPAIVKLFNRS